MSVLLDLSPHRKQFAKENQRATWFTRGILARPREEIEKLERFSAKRLSMKKDLEPSADVTAINREFGLRAFIEGFDV